MKGMRDTFVKCKMLSKYLQTNFLRLEHSYISSSVKKIKTKLEGKSTEQANEAFNDVSTQFIDLYFNILEKFSKYVNYYFSM